MSLKEVKTFLTTPIKAKDNLTALQCLRLEGRVFINELITFYNELSD
jgi:hypothetical protein